METNSLLALIPLAPLFGAVLAYLIGQRIPRMAGVIATAAAATSFVLTLICVLSIPEHSALDFAAFKWFAVGHLDVDFAFRLDHLSAVMCLIITGIGSLIHLYATGYMAEDDHRPRFFAYLNLFLFAMLLLVLGSNLLVLFVGWEGVGLCSYLLIGFWFKNPAFAAAGRKAFVVNRIGDAGFLLGTFLVFWYLGSVDFETVRKYIGAVPITTELLSLITLITMAFFVAATGKSAQLPLFVWLPDAMAGPTPVSALIHAATMVTAGVYLLARLWFLFSLSQITLFVVTLVALVTALVAAITAVTQTDIKKVLAYSTVSQLGFMFLGAGAGVFWVGIFHVVTHAFFKACLFLGAGSVIHGCHHEQDMREMGGLARLMPITFVTYLISVLAIAGIYPFAGYQSKHAILQALATCQNTYILEWSGVILFTAKAAAMLTAFYMTRSLMLTFFGKYRGHAHPHESPASMWIPLVVLAALACVGGIWLQSALPEYLAPALGMQLHEHHAESIIDGVIGSWIGLVGMGLAVLMYGPLKGLPSKLFALLEPLGKLSQNKFYLDELYAVLIIQPAEYLATVLWKLFDQIIVDGIVNGTGAVVDVSGEVVRGIQTGQTRHYAFIMFAATCFVVIFYLVL